MYIHTHEKENSIKEVTKTLKNAGFDQEFISALQNDEIKSKNFVIVLSIIVDTGTIGWLISLNV